jgi:hypothetical protein
MVITAAHCLLIARTNSWVKPDDVHFVPPAENMGHSIAESFMTSPDFNAHLRLARLVTRREHLVGEFRRT